MGDIGDIGVVILNFYALFGRAGLATMFIVKFTGSSFIAAVI